MNARWTIAAVGVVGLLVSSLKEAPPARAQVQAPAVGRTQEVQARVFKPIRESYFDQSPEGWGIVNAEGWLESVSYDSQNQRLFYIPDDGVNFGDWFWDAPEDFLGDLAAAYDGGLFFSQASQGTDLLPDISGDIVLTGKLPDGTPGKITFDNHNLPTSALTDIAAFFTEREWRLNGAQPTRKQLVCILSTAKTLRMRGRYHQEFPGKGTLDAVAVSRRVKNKPKVQALPKAGKVDFGFVDLGGTSLKQIEISNPGTAPLKIEFELKNSRPDNPFSLEFGNEFYGYVAPGDKETVLVRYKATEIAKQKATLTVTTGDKAHKKVVFKLQGRGKEAVASGIVVTPDPIDFGTASGADQPQVNLRITNQSKFTRSLVCSVGPNPTFFQGTLPVFLTLQAGAHDDSWISFQNTGNGTFNGELLIKDDQTLEVLVRVPIHATRVNAAGKRR